MNASDALRVVLEHFDAMEADMETEGDRQTLRVFRRRIEQQLEQAVGEQIEKRMEGTRP